MPSGANVSSSQLLQKPWQNARLESSSKHLLTEALPPENCHTKGPSNHAGEALRPPKASLKRKSIQVAAQNLCSAAASQNSFDPQDRHVPNLQIDQSCRGMKIGFSEFRRKSPRPKLF